MKKEDINAFIQNMAPAAVRAGLEVLVMREAGLEVEHKEDTSPVTEADRRAEAILLEALETHGLGLPVIAEENAEEHGLPENMTGPFVLVDPVDGTKEFISGGDSFTVNIGLVENGNPVAGLVYAPARDTLYLAVPDGAARLTRASGDVETEQISTRTFHFPPTIVASRSHRTPETDTFIAGYDGAETVSIGSSLKFCLVAEGAADIYPRFGPTMEWDTAAAHAVLLSAGGIVLDEDGKPFRYGKPGFKNGHFIAWGDRNKAGESTEEKT